jgi:shikimate kinase
MHPQLKIPLRLALIGMSGAGKTFWSRVLASAGHPAISCDDKIEQRLASRLEAGGYSGINGVAAWMGWPDSPPYAERESQYLSDEIAVVEGVLGDLARSPEKSLVLDTTGSVIYTGNHHLMRLRKLMTVVHLAASPQEQQLLIERYLNDPKPVLWRGAFQPKDGETPRQTVARCYPNLISARRQSYAALAHCTIEVAQLRELPHDPSAFLKLVEKSLAGAA